MSLPALTADMIAETNKALRADNDRAELHELELALARVEEELARTDPYAGKMPNMPETWTSVRYRKIQYRKISLLARIFELQRQMRGWT